MVVTVGPQTRPLRIAALCVARLTPLALVFPTAAVAQVDWSVTAAVAGLPATLGQDARLSASPASDDVVWLTLGDGRVYVSTDAGLTWAGQHLAPGRVTPLPKPAPRQPPLKSFVPQPRRAEGMPSASQVLGFSALEASFDDPVGSPSTLSLRAFSEELWTGRGVLTGPKTDPAPNRLYAANARTAADGKLFRVDVTPLPAHPRAAIARGNDGGVWRTDDAGATWRPVNAATAAAHSAPPTDEVPGAPCGRRVGLTQSGITLDGVDTSLDADALRGASACAVGAHTVWWLRAGRLLRAVPSARSDARAARFRPRLRHALESALSRAGAGPPQAPAWLLGLAPSLHVGVQAQRIALDSTRRSAFSDEPGAGPGAFNRGPLEPFDATVLLRWDLARLFESERASAHRAARRRTEDVERQTMAALASWSAAEARLGDTAALTPLARAQTEVAAEAAAAAVYMLAGAHPEDLSDSVQE